MADRKSIVPKEHSPNALYSPGVQVGELLFVSGQVALDKNGKVVGVGDFEAQARHIMSRIRAVIEASGGTMKDVIKITTFLTNAADYSVFNQVRSETFPSNPPASTAVIVAALLRPELLVEVEAVAHIR
jgi:reactive intermediate/imine deaminase